MVRSAGKQEVIHSENKEGKLTGFGGHGEMY
jgi:hypothetical protein